MKHAGGRPTKFTPELAEEICEVIATGHSLNSICKRADMPDYSTVLRWLSRESDFRDEFRGMYEYAREDQADTMADEILEIADDTSNDTILVESKDGTVKPVINREWISRCRLRVDSRKWIAMKLKPRKYGKRLGMVSAVGQPLSPQKHEVKFFVLDSGQEEDG